MTHSGFHTFYNPGGNTTVRNLLIWLIYEIIIIPPKNANRNLLFIDFFLAYKKYFIYREVKMSLEEKHAY